MCGKGSSGGGGYAAGLPAAQQSFTQASPEAMNWYRQAMNLGQQAVQQPYQRFGTTPQEFVAQLTPEQQQATQNIGQQAQAGQPYYAAAPAMQAAAGMGNAAQMAGAYMNPFMQQVVSPVQQALQQQQGQQLAQQQAEAIKGGAFGGQRAGLQRAVLQGQQQLGMGQALSPLYQTGYGQALGAAQTDLARQLAAGQGLGQAGLGAQQALLGAGTLGQQTQQAGINALYNQFQQAQMFPYMQAQFLGGLAGGLGPLLGQTTTQTQAQNPFGMFLSDPRAKTGVDRSEPEVVGELYDGQKVHAYKYKDGGPAQIGLMADEVADRHPDAVGIRPDGLMAVDYAKATEDAARMGGAVNQPGDYSRGGYADGGLTSADIASIVAAQQAMYGQMPKSQMAIPTEGIRTGTPLTPANIAPPTERPSGLSGALKTGETISDLLTKGADLYSWYQGDKTKGPSALAHGKSAGGEVPNDEDPWKDLLSGIHASQPLKPAEFASPESDRDSRRPKSFLDTASDVLGTAGKLGGAASGLYSAATTLGPALMALSDPSAKTGVGRPAYADGGFSPEEIDAYLRPLAKGESGGERDPYAALGPVTKKGDRAYGKYQVMGANIPSWSKEAGLGALTPEEFLANKEAQEAVARNKFGEYLSKTGSPQEAAAMWFSGPEYKKHAGARDVLGTSIPEYQARYQRNLEGGLGDALSKMGPRERSFEASAKLPDEGSTVDLKQPTTGVKPSDEEGFGLNRQTIIPALAGIGAAIEGMTSSPSRYLGTALLRGAGAGLGAGAKSYMETGLQIPEIEKRKQEALKEAQEVKAKEQLVGKLSYEKMLEEQKLHQGAFFERAGIPMVRLADGSEVSQYEWMKHPTPVWSGGEGAAAAPATSRPIGVGDTTATAPAGIGWDPRSKTTATNELQVTMGPGKAAAEARSAAYRAQVDKDAEAAYGQKLYNNDVAGIISDAIQKTGAAAPGATASTRAVIINYANTIARAAGLGENYMGSGLDSNDAILRKLTTLSGQRGVSEAGQTALGSLEKLVSAQPNLDQPPQASTFNAASNMVNNQMKIDQQLHADTYGQHSGGLYSRAGIDFKRVNTPGKYRKEQDILQNVMVKDPEAFQAMISGKLDPAHIEQYFRDRAHGGVPGMSRYFES